MAEKTTETPAASADDLLNEAAADAVASQEEAVEEVEEEVQAAPEEEAEELVEEELPTDHSERSNLGRKVSAFHRRQDEFEQRIDKMLDLLEATNKAKDPEPEDPLDGMDDNEPLTAGELRSILSKREEAAQIRSAQQTETQVKAQQQYDVSYQKSFQRVAADLPEDEFSGILEEMKTLSYNPTGDPAADAEMNFYKAERAYLRKKVAQPIKKQVPLKGDKPPGVVTNNKVETKTTALPKLDAAGESYLAYVRSNDGAEAAEKLHRGLAREQ